MSFGGLILTNVGRNKIATAISEKDVLKFTHIQLGDGSFNGSYSSKTALSDMVMEIPVTRIQRKDNEVLIECDWNSKQAPTAFYLREIGIIGNGVLCYYDNARDGDAEYIDPESDAVTKQKRFRFTVSVTDEVEITTMISSGIYALANEVERSLSEIKDVKIDKTGDAKDVIVTFSEAESRESISAGEKLSVIFGKISKFLSDLKTVAFSGSYKDLTDKPTAKDIGLGNVGNYKAVSTVASQGLSDTEKANARANIGAAPTSHASTATTYGVSTAANYGHAMASSTTPKANGTAAAGSETAKFARGDHVHPLQTSVSGSSGSCTGNAATATKLSTARTIRTSLASTSTASFDGSANITPGVTGTLPVANGGTGKTTLTSGQVLVGNGTGAISQREIDTTAGGTQDSTALITSGAVYDGMCYKSISITGTGNLSISSIFSGDYSDLSITLYATDNSNARNMYTWFIPTATIPSSGNLHLISGYKSGNYEGIGDVLITGRTTVKIVSCIFGGVQYNTTARLVIRYR